MHALIPALLVRSVVLGINLFAGKKAQRDRQIDMRTDQVLGVLVTQLHGDQCSPVTALGAEFVIPQHLLHQSQPQVSGRDKVDARGGQRRGKAKAGQRGDDHIKGVLGVAAKRGRIGQWPDDVLEIPEGPRPAVGQDQRYGIGTLARLMNEVDGNVLDGGRVVGKGVDLALGGAPVVAVQPVLDQLHQVGFVRAVGPVGIIEIVRPAHPAQATPQVGQGLFGNSNRKRLFLHARLQCLRGALSRLTNRRHREWPRR